ncbi:MAG: methyltransferase domain-containing protein [Gammaproteobacteria bacterium]|nr:methyltransferase domain-containing protein [Gammaproteobacteria bacterium]
MIERSGRDLLNAESHFAFGKNWESYAELIDASRISEAQRSLARLLGNEGLAGKRFLDIGCGSGLHSLAALRLGATEVLAVDIDADSVATAAAVLSRHAPGKNFSVRQASVFEMAPTAFGQFDVVYSWGVLHHTGDLRRALRSASALVAPGGLFVFALYRKTWSCGFWKLEKRWYAHAEPAAQRKVCAVYLGLYRVGLGIRGRSFRRYVDSYKTRGMDFYHDVHDWLGGYPYESMSPREVAGVMTELSMVPVRAFLHLGRLGRLLGRNPGFLGSGCDEYVYARPRDSA